MLVARQKVVKMMNESEVKPGDFLDFNDEVIKVVGMPKFVASDRCGLWYVLVEREHSGVKYQEDFCLSIKRLFKITEAEVQNEA